MNVDGAPYRSIWVNDDGISIDVIDQTRLPHEFRIVNLRTLDDACGAIGDMVVRGAPLIGATAAFGFYLAMLRDASDSGMDSAYESLYAARPTAVNLRWALDRTRASLTGLEPDECAACALETDQDIAELDVDINQQIGTHGLQLINDIAAQTIYLVLRANIGD